MKLLAKIKIAKLQKQLGALRALNWRRLAKVSFGIGLLVAGSLLYGGATSQRTIVELKLATADLALPELSNNWQSPDKYVTENFLVQAMTPLERYQFEQAQKQKAIADAKLAAKVEQLTALPLSSVKPERYLTKAEKAVTAADSPAVSPDLASLPQTTTKTATPNAPATTAATQVAVSQAADENLATLNAFKNAIKSVGLDNFSFSDYRNDRADP